MTTLPRFLAFTVALTLPGTITAAQIHLGQHNFTLPDGFTMEQVAGPPLVNRPISADFDEQGRLYITDSSGSNDPVKKQLEEKPHRVVRLEDTDGDGRYDKTVVFADRLMFPEGAMWYAGSLYVSAPPSIWKLTDTNGDGVADRREEWFDGKTLTGCANDLHGPYLGPDGWIYWCKGAFAEQTYQRPGKPPLVTRASHIFRARPDNSGTEPVLTGGMDNPVSVAFTPGGERIMCGTFFIHPQAGQRDGLIHAIYGGVYGKIHDVLNGHKRTGDYMPIMTHLGPAAPCSVIRYRADVFGKEYQDNLFACLFNLHKVTRHIVEPDGATLKTQDIDFVVSDNPDFHPTQVLEDADGSLLIFDTGGWYKICCPTSQLWKPDVLGAVYRVHRNGAPKINDPRGQKIDWAKTEIRRLTALLADPRPDVRDRAIAELGRRGDKALPELKKVLTGSTTHKKSKNLDLTLTETPAVDARRNAVWALTRMESPAARETARIALHDADQSVCLAAIHSASVWRDKAALPKLLPLLENKSPALARAAAEAVGRMEDKSAVPNLLAATSHPHDRALDHSLIYALIEIADPSSTGAGLHSASADTQRAALVALDQMDGGGLTPDRVTPFLTSRDRGLKEAANWIVSHHVEWADALAGFFKGQFVDALLRKEAGDDLRAQLAQFAGDSSIQHFLGDAIADPVLAPECKLIALQAMAQARLKQVPSDWSPKLARLVKGHNVQLARQAVLTARSWALPSEQPELRNALLDVAGDQTIPAENRLDAFAALPGGLRELSSDEFSFLAARVAPSEPVLTRGTAAAILAKARLNAEQLSALSETIKSAGPLEITKLLGAFEKATNEATGLKLVAALKESKGVSGLRVETLQPFLAKFPPSVQKEGESLLAQLNVDAGKQKSHLDQLLSSLKDGDVRRGQAIFNSAKAACSTCHAIGYLGGKVGPDLTRIGQIRTERDMLEAIVYPSASFVRSYEPLSVATKDGEDYNGILKSENADELVLVTGPNVEQRIPRSQIAEMRPGTVSLMPGGLDEQLSKQELADLLAFLKATKW